ncbi:MAG TPA: hypothetical protein VED00_00585 [archaeon]|nr:hypothetical protein [archaeon]
MSTQPFSLRVKIGNYEIELSGTREEVLQALNDLPEIVNKVSKAFVSTQPSTSVTSQSLNVTEKPVATGSSYPSISTTESCSDALTQLFSSDWAKEKPRTLSDTATVLEANALHYPIATVAKTLERLTRRNKLRRWKTEEGYVYVLA